MSLSDKLLLAGMALEAIGFFMLGWCFGSRNRHQRYLDGHENGFSAAHALYSERANLRMSASQNGFPTLKVVK